MEPANKNVAITGAGSGIGRALAIAFAKAGAARIAIFDLDQTSLVEVESELKQYGCEVVPVTIDVSDRGALQEALAMVDALGGGIEVMCSNAGIARGGGVEAPIEAWSDSWAVNLMAHVYAAEFLVPKMTERGGGYFVHTASAAGLLTNLGAAPYAVTKHAAVALSEWMAITYADQNIKVSCLCPQGVRTKMLFPPTNPSDPTAQLSQASVTSAGQVLEPTEVAEAVLDAMREERFLVLPHQDVAKYLQHKVSDYDGWISAMVRYSHRLDGL